MDGQSLSGWTLVFDLDGTLVDTAPDLLAALNHVLAGEGIAPVALDDIRTMIGAGAKAMIREGLARSGTGADEARIDRLWTRFLDHYQAHIADHSRPFDGIETLLPQLQTAGARIAVCTNKTQALSDQLLAALNLQGQFDAVVGADTVPRKKPDGDHILRTIDAAGGTADKAIMVGDSRTDERAARNAALPFVFVTFGYEQAAVEDIQADIVIDDYSAFWPAVSGLVS